MKTPPKTGISIAEAIAKIFTRAGKPAPRIVVDPTKGPSWSPITNVVTLPALPTHDLTDEEQTMLRAFFWHEAQGEFGNNTWWDHPAIKGNPQRHMLANGVGDGYLDLLILADRPGAGTDIRKQVQLDCKGLLADGPKVKPTVGVAACLARYLIEGVTTWPSIRKSLVNCGPLLDVIQPVMPTKPILKDGMDVVSLTLALDKALEQYKANHAPKDQPKDQPKGPKGPKGKPTPTSGEEGEDSGEMPDISLEQSDSQPSGDGEGEGEGQGEGEGEGSGEGESDSDSEGGESDGEAEGEGKGKPSDTDGEGAASGGSGPRDLDLGEDSGERIGKELAEMLTGNSGAGQGSASRTFLEDFRAVVPGKAMDAYLAGRGHPMTYTPSASVRHDASVMLVRLRAALQGPSMRIERGQEYGRFDARRSAAALAGSRTVYTRRREIKADSVAVSVAWDESGSMDGPKIRAVRSLVERMALALSQMTDVATEFTGWTTGCAPEEIFPGAGGYRQDLSYELQESAAHTAGGDVTHRLYKSFAETAVVLGPRLPSIVARDGTPMTEGLAFSTKRLAQRAETRKVMFFLTDGQACGNDCSTTTPWGYNALKYEVDRATASGIMVVVFGIGMDTTATLQAQLANLDANVSMDAAAKEAQRQRLHATHLKREKQNVEPWGSNAQVVLLPDDSTVIQLVINSLVKVLTKQSRAIAS